ncbi:DUF305 domain-containing protein [Cytophagaceae bacterium ABcell3]|nr:DUF305 domain-containing protein [Cytophagaceae bacterium ABcell3]
MKVKVLMMFVGALFLLGSCGERPATSERRGPAPEVTDANLLNVVEEALADMRDVELTGDPDYDFASLMQRHKEAGIQIADEQIARGDDVLLIELAERVVRNSERDLLRFEEFTDEFTPEDDRRTFRDAVSRYLEVAEDEVGEVEITGDDIDSEFAQAIALHHDQGVRLARIYETYGRSAELVELARNIIATQEAELHALDAYINGEDEDI